MRILLSCLALGVAVAAVADDVKPPQLVTPDANFQLSQPVNGWTFVWQLPPGIAGPEKYELWVQAKASRKPLIDLFVEKTAYTFVQQGPTGGGGWIWKVRTYSGGQYGAWSEERAFRVLAVSNPSGAGEPVAPPPPPPAAAPVAQAPQPVPQPQAEPGGQEPAGGEASAEIKALEKTLLARIVKKQSDAQAFYQHYLAAHRRRGEEAIAKTYEEDAKNAMAERNAAELALCDLYLHQGRGKEAVGRLGDLARRGVVPAIAKLNEIEFDEAKTLLAQGHEKAAIARLEDLHRREYGPATDLLRQMDRL